MNRFWLAIIVATLALTACKPIQPGGSSNPTTQPAKPVGVRQLNLYNCASNGATVKIWTYDQAAGWQELGEATAGYNGSLCGPVAGTAPFVVSLVDAREYLVVATDPSLIGCSGNDPRNTACHRWAVHVLGNAQGPVIPYTIA